MCRKTQKNNILIKKKEQVLFKYQKTLKYATRTKLIREKEIVQ
jgi:hypothetical protein